MRESKNPWKWHCSHKKHKQIRPARNQTQTQVPSCCPLPTPLPLHEMLVFLAGQQHCIMKVRSIPASHVESRPQAGTKPSKPGTKTQSSSCASDTRWSHRSVLTRINWWPWNSEGSREKPEFSVPKLEPQERNYRIEEIFTVTNRKAHRHSRFVKRVADCSPMLSES